MHYSEREDVLKNPVFLPSEQAADMAVIPVDSLRLYGPGVIGCQNHHKAAMLSFSIKSEEYSITDMFLGKAAAQALLDTADCLQAEMKGNAVTSLAGDYCLRFDRQIDGDTLVLRPNREWLGVFLKELSSNRAEIEAFIAAPRDPDFDFDTMEKPRRHTPEEIEQRSRAAQAFLDEYYKPDIFRVPVGAVDRGLLFAALYNNANSGGKGLQHYSERQMTPEEGRHVMDEIARLGANPEIDYINGRSIKTYFEERAEGLFLNASRFWDYNEIPFVAVLAAASQGIYRRLTAPDLHAIRPAVEDFFNTASFSPASKDKTCSRTIATIDLLAQKRSDGEESPYRDAFRQAQRDYQLSICGNGPVQGEIGDKVRPFVFPVLKAV